MKKSSLCTIVKNKKIATNTFRMLLQSNVISETAKPGQFIHIKVPADQSLILRRPFGISDVFDDSSGIVEIIYQVAGKGTTILSNLKSKTYIDVIGPLGNGFMKSDKSSIYVVGGGCGIAPLKYLVKNWGDALFTSFLGFKSKSFSYDLSHFYKYSNDIIVTTDDGTLGFKGVITDQLRTSMILKGIPDMILGCGPVKMLGELQKIANEFNVPCQLSLEERMGCGIGGCLVCACSVLISNVIDYKKVCIDGPVFWSNEVTLNPDES